MPCGAAKVTPLDHTPRRSPDDTWPPVDDGVYMCWCWPLLCLQDKQRHKGSPSDSAGSLQQTHSAPAAVIGAACGHDPAVQAAPAGHTNQQQHGAANGNGTAALPTTTNGTGAAHDAAPAANSKLQELVAVHRRSSSDSALPSPSAPAPTGPAAHHEPQPQKQQQQQPCPAPLPASAHAVGVLRTNSGSSTTRRASMLSDSGRASRRSSLQQSSDGALLPPEPMMLDQQQLQQAQTQGPARACVAFQLPAESSGPSSAADSPPPSVAQQQQQQQPVS